MSFPVRFLGTCSATPEAYQDCTCMLLDHDILIDTGFSGVIDLLNWGENPCGVDYVFITHCHQDHIMGLPQLLFYQGMRGHFRRCGRPLRVVGPRGEIEEAVERACAFLRTEKFPEVVDRTEVVGLRPGECYETERFQVTTCESHHPVPGLCYGFQEKASGARVVFTGDTSYHEGLSRHCSGADLLVHEASMGCCRAAADCPWGHSGSLDAARVACEGGVGRLALVHYAPSLRGSLLCSAGSVFGSVLAPLPGEELLVGG